MLPLRYAGRWQAVSAVLLLAVLAGAVMPAVWLWPDRVRIVSWLDHIDKWAHLLVFAFLAVWFAGQYRRSAYWRIAAGLVGFGILIELCQGLISYRSAEWPDLGADVIGIAAGLSLALIGAGGWCLAAENWYARRTVNSGDD